MPHVKPDLQLSYTTTGKIGFPYYHRGGLLRLFRKVPFGWEIRGKSDKKCSICGNKAFIGEQDNKTFLFCKVCLNQTLIQQ